MKEIEWTDLNEAYEVARERGAEPEVIYKVLYLDESGPELEEVCYDYEDMMLALEDIRDGIGPYAIPIVKRG